MFSNKHCSFLFISVIFITTTQGYKLKRDLNGILQSIYKLSDKNKIIADNESIDHDQDTNILDLLKNNAKFEYDVDNDLKRRKERKGPNKILVKRIVKHGRKTPKVQNIEMFGFSYKPLVRLHSDGKSQNRKFNDRSEVVRNQVREDLDRIYRKLSKRSKALRDDIANTSESENVISYLIEIDNMVNKLQLPHLSEEWHNILSKTYSFIAPQVEQLHQRAVKTVATYKKLRSGKPLTMVLIRGDEEELQLYSRPQPVPQHRWNKAKATRFKIVSDRNKGNVRFGSSIRTKIGAAGTEEHDKKKSDEIKKKDKSKLRPPHKPYWDEWTNEPKVPVDECPGELVKHGNMCIELPPHRL